MRVFMLGWEFPPYISGGLGTACHGLTRGLDEVGVEVCFVLPTAIPVGAGAPGHVKLRSPVDLAAEERRVARQFEHLALRRVDAVLMPYAAPAAHEQIVRSLIEAEGVEVLARPSPGEAPAGQAGAAGPAAGPTRGMFVHGGGVHYAGDLMGQVYRYARLAVELARRESFDVVHAHDWMTYPAGLAVAAACKRPLVVHVHSTEFDRSGENVNQQVYDIERMGMHGADTVVCVSHLTRNIVLHRYQVPPQKVEVVYNAVEAPGGAELETPPIGHTEKIVLFLGRLTMQKGPEYFLMAARKVVQKFANVRFVMAGSGDMIAQCVRLAADLNIGRYVAFTGFLRGDDVDKVFRMADLYVMPSVSEPFGIAPLEALSHNVPVIISKTSGVSEVLTHVLKVDFWDVDEMANKILAVLRHPPLQKTLRHHGQIELRKLSWRDSALKVKTVYEKLAAG